MKAKDVYETSKIDVKDLSKPKVKPKGVNKAEQYLQVAVASYVKMNYKDVDFISESSGIRVGPGPAQLLSAIRSKGKLPDMTFLEPRAGYCGMALELKADGCSPYLKDGSLSTDKHVIEQAKTLARLRSKGFFAEFATGYKEAIWMIDRHMSHEPTKNIGGYR